MRCTRRARGKVVKAMLAMLAIAGMLALAGCGGGGGTVSAGSTPTAGFPVSITDDAARKVTFSSAPKRIVSLAPANTEIISELGILDRLVGVTTYDDYPASVAGIPKMGDFTTPNLEAIAGAKPDVILVTGGVQAEVLSKLEGLGAKVVVIDPRTIAGVAQAITKVGTICGVPDAAKKANGRFETRLSAVRKAIEGAKPVSCFIEVGYDPLFTAGRDTLLDDVLTQAGGANVVKEKDYVGYSVEQLVTDQPEVYLGTKSSLGDVSGIAQRPGYAGLSALKAGKVFALDDNLVSRPGPRIVEGVEQVARALHPDRF